MSFVAIFLFFLHRERREDYVKAHICSLKYKCVQPSQLIHVAVETVECFHSLHTRPSRHRTSIKHQKDIRLQRQSDVKFENQVAECWRQTPTPDLKTD